MSRVAYLVNQYPKVSHTFIRREIQALEAEGVEVARYTVRPTLEHLVDEADRDELARTESLLGRSLGSTLKAVGYQAFVRPGRFLSAAKAAAKMGARSDRGLLRHGAYLVEACVLERLLASRRVEHLHAHFGTNSATVAALCHRLGGPKFSFTVHGPEEFDKPAAIGLEHKIREGAFVVAISDYGKSQLMRQSAHDDWSKIAVIRCGLDASYLEREPSPPPDTRRLVCVGRLSEQKGQLLLVEAVAEIKRAGIPSELVLAGDGEMRGDIEELVSEHGLESQVRITGWLDASGIQRELEAARALVLPSFAEGLPVVIMEAMALGRPVLSTYVAGIPELVVPGETGWLVPAGSVAALADGLKQVLETPPDELRRLGECGRQRVRELHDVRLSARELKGWIERAASGTT